MNLGYPIAGEERTHPDHGEKDGDGTEGGLRWGDARDLLREIEAIDCHVQCGENPVLALRSLVFVSHGKYRRWLWERSGVWRLRGESETPSGRAPAR